MELPVKLNHQFAEGVLEKAIDEYNQRASEHKCYGELIHGSYPDNFANINLTNVSHITNRVSYEKDQLVADITILETPTGEMLKDKYIFANVELAARGIGTFTEECSNTLSAYKFISLDLIQKHEE